MATKFGPKFPGENDVHTAQHVMSTVLVVLMIMGFQLPPPWSEFCLSFLVPLFVLGCLHCILLFVLPYFNQFLTPEEIAVWHKEIITDNAKRLMPVQTQRLIYDEDYRRRPVNWYRVERKVFFATRDESCL